MTHVGGGRSASLTLLCINSAGPKKGEFWTPDVGRARTSGELPPPPKQQ